MRYLNWDVLIFAEGSKTPIQEFRTHCFMTADFDLKQLHTPSPYSGPAPRHSLGQLPTVVCFIPSLEHGRHFQVSVHCWEPPEPSPEILAVISDKKAISFEARIVIDGVVTSGLAFKGHEPTPHTIDSFLGQDGLTQHLAFPPFHSELLTQSYWNASESLGRIKVVISEGTYCNHQGSSFERRKNIVCFAFQHAPLSILQDANIAWPNPNVFCCAETGAVSTLSGNRTDHTVHGHSPHREMTKLAINERVYTAPYNVTTVPSMLPPHGLECIHEEPGTSLMSATFHTPIEQASIVPKRNGANRASSSDISMPDYEPLKSWEGSRQSSSHENGPRSLDQALSQSMSDIVYTGLRSRGHTVGTRDDPLEGFPEELDPVSIGRTREEPLTPSRMMSRTLQTYDGTSPNHDSTILGSHHFDEAFYSPIKNVDGGGTLAPANTRVNSATNGPMEMFKSGGSTKSESPCPAFHHSRAVPITASDSRFNNVRETSKENQASVGSVEQDSAERLPRTPTAKEEFKGRKEGTRAVRKPFGFSKRTTSRKTSGANTSTSNIDPGQLAEGKRKREDSATSIGDTIGDSQGQTPWPARKVSKAKCQADIGTENGKAGEGVKRAPLSNLLNC